MNARIEPAEPPFDAGIQTWLDKVMPPGLPPLTLFTTLARDPRLFEKFFSGGLLDKGNLTLRQRELVILRTTARCQSEYEWGVHVALFAERVGFTTQHQHSLVHGVPGDSCWSKQDRCLLELCDQLHDTSTLDNCLWLVLRNQFSETALIELLLLAGFYRTVSYLTNALQLPPESFAARFDSIRSGPDR